MLNKSLIVIHFNNYGNIEVSGDYEEDLINGLKNNKVVKVRDKRGEAIIINPNNIVYFRIANTNI